MNREETIQKWESRGYVFVRDNIFVAEAQNPRGSAVHTFNVLADEMKEMQNPSDDLMREAIAVLDDRRARGMKAVPIAATETRENRSENKYGGGKIEKIEEKKAIKVEDKKTERKMEEKVSKAEIVPAGETEAYALMDRRDEEQIMQELQGAFLSEFVYSFQTSTGGKVTGLSWAGVKEVSRRMGNLSVEDVHISETESSYRVMAKAKDLARNVTMFGVAEQVKTMTLRSGASVPDPFALSKAVSKAQRNALRALVPEMFIKTLIEQYLAAGTGK